MFGLGNHVNWVLSGNGSDNGYYSNCGYDINSFIGLINMKIQIKILNEKFYGSKNQHHYDPILGLMDNGTPNKLPSYATPGSAGLDLRCTEDITIYPGETKMIPTGLAIWIGSRGDKEPYGLLSPGANRNSRYDLIDYIRVAGFILPRSGLGNKGLILANTIGTIDEDYQGELKISAWNRLTSDMRLAHTGMTNKGRKVDLASASGVYVYSDEYLITEEKEHNIIELKAGDRIAQLVFMPVIKAEWDVVEEFSESTERGAGGFGSTGG